MRARAFLACCSTTTIVACAAPIEEPPPPTSTLSARWTVDGVVVGADGVVFADTAFGQETTTVVGLENTGAEPFTVVSSPPLFAVGGAVSSFAIGPVSSVTVPKERPLLFPIAFRPDGTGPLSATFSFRTRLGDGPPLVLRGIGGEGDGTSGVDVDCFDGAFDLLPDFDELEPSTSKVHAAFTLGDRVGTDEFACRYRATIEVPAAGPWTFFTTADDGVQLLIDDEMVVDDDGTHGAREVAGEVPLTAGAHDIEVRFFEASGGETLEVRWQGPGRAKELMPPSSLRRR